jgi:hypothetical protein
MFIDQARATGGANRPPPNDPLARSVSKKNLNSQGTHGNARR